MSSDSGSGELVRRVVGRALVIGGWSMSFGTVVVGWGAAMDMDPPPEPPWPFAVALGTGVLAAHVGRRVLRRPARPWND